MKSLKKVETDSVDQIESKQTIVQKHHKVYKIDLSIQYHKFAISPSLSF